MNISELVSIQFLLRFAACPPTKASWKEITEYAFDMLENGMNTIPLLVVNPIDNEIRLDSGNHRVYFLPLVGVAKIKCECFISNKTIQSSSNGLHKYDGKNLIKSDTIKYLNQYVKISDVLYEY